MLKSLRRQIFEWQLVNKLKEKIKSVKMNGTYNECCIIFGNDTVNVHGATPEQLKGLVDTFWDRIEKRLSTYNDAMLAKIEEVFGNNIQEATELIMQAFWSQFADLASKCNNSFPDINKRLSTYEFDLKLDEIKSELDEIKKDIKHESKKTRGLMTKVVIIVVLVVCVVIGLGVGIPLTNKSGPDTEILSIGPDAYYILEDGTMTIYGSGEATSTIPSAGVREVIIEEGITSICDDAFKDCTTLKSITIADSLTSIGTGTFSGCTSIETATMPAHVIDYIPQDSLTTVVVTSGNIDVNTFSGCAKLTNLTIGENVKSIVEGAFAGCTGLTSLTVDEGNKTYYSESNCIIETERKTLIAVCTALTNIDIPDGVTSIGSGVFSNCSGLTSITIPDSVESIGANVFSSCTGLTSVTIGDGVTSIGAGAFSGCTSIKTATMPAHAIDYIPQYSLTIVEITSGDIGAYVFSGCRGLTSVTIGDGVKSIAFNAFSGCKSIETAIMPAHAIGYIPQDSLTTVVITSGDSISDRAFEDCGTLTSIIIPDSITSIGYYAFSGCYGIIETEGGVSYVDDWAIDCDASATSVQLREGTRGIATWAFTNCTGLTSITIPDSVTSIAHWAFDYCPSLTSITIPDSVVSIGYWAFKECTGLTSITVEDGNAVYHSDGNCLIETASKTLIAGCQTSVIPSDGSVTSIEDDAFSYCSGLTSIVIPNIVTNIGDFAFSGCTSLTDVYYQGDLSGWLGIEFGDSRTNPMYYADNLYINGELLQGELVIPEGTEKIGSYAFYNCSNLTSVTIPDSVTSIGEHAFFGCTGLMSIVIPDSVESIESGAFSGCTGLTSITIPDSVTWISDEVFDDCAGLTDVYYQGDLSGWLGIEFGNFASNPMEYAANLYIKGKLLQGELVIPEGTEKIGDHAFYNCDGLTSITIPDSVTSIGDWAFNGCKGLTSITIPDSVTSIGGWAFFGCTGLTDVYYQGDLSGWLGIEFGNFASNPMEYAANLYIKGKLLQGELVIPEGTEKIGDYAFRGYTGLTSVAIPDGVTSIGGCAFYGCTGLTSITIPDSVTSIGDGAFHYCTGLTSVTIGNGVTSIGEEAFRGCSGLTSITISDSVTSIGGRAFFNCTGLTIITIPDSVTSIGPNAFYNCGDLTDIIFQGTMQQWNDISKGTDWNFNTPDYTVTCTDGVLDKDGQQIG